MQILQVHTSPKQLIYKYTAVAHLCYVRAYNFLACVDSPMVLQILYVRTYYICASNYFELRKIMTHYKCALAYSTNLWI